ncbi:type IV secretory system conjugative DNA transfer family protein [Octadecabacter ascidiaceicola]|uniref:Conjugal transfer protein TraG n=1 Tax=Octadecabacter ascidiaceicola TaxID=1655543 RepID=A0A238K987_9RHOB|nr:type IV secretory system conjugative DNA transfer family protein [Octadecabacter ascidiaceicola]SMX39419.1 Conjugal transfer protein TraG [Octadecabacter ascidiaceicola]
MDWKKTPYALPAVALGGLFLCLFVIFPMVGISVLGSQNLSLALTLSKIIMILLASACGFVLGWFFSPSAKGVRHILLWCAGAVLLAAALMLNGSLGWSATSVVAIIGFFVALGHWLKRATQSWFNPPDTFGSSRWATMDDLAKHKVLNDDGIRFGQCLGKENFEWISYKGDRHLLTIAPTRSGKGTTQIIPNLLTYEGSMLVIDPKGENAMITAKQRMKMGHEVHIVDPWGIVDLDLVKEDAETDDVFVVSSQGDVRSTDDASAFNPLDWLQDGDPDITENAMILADALILPNTSSDAFWDEEAKALLHGIILYVATDPAEDGRRHLGRVRELLLMDGKTLRKFFEHMLTSRHHIVQSTGARCLQKEEKLLANVFASAQAHTHFLDSERLRSSLISSSFKFEDLKTKPITIYLVLPADRLNTFSRWLRLLIQQAITVNARNIQIKPKKPVLFVLDEFAALGRLTMVEQAYGLMAGFGMQLWAIVQDLSQLERVYDKGWQSFIANAGMVNYFGSSDQKTAEYFSALCGEKTVWNFGSSVADAFAMATDANGKRSRTETTTFTSNTSATQRKLAFPDELMRLHPDSQLVFVENMHPMKAYKENWFDDDVLKHLGVNLHQSDEIEATDQDVKND